MEAKPIVADYSLDTLISATSEVASIDKVLERYAAYDEDVERKRRERMLAAHQAMARNGHSSAPRGRNHVFAIHGDGSPVEGDSEDTAMADGLSLAQGSREHEVYVRDRSGMDRFERRRADMASIGFGTKGDMQAPGADEFHDERYEELSHQDADTAADNELQLSKDDTMVAERLEDHVLKHEQAERIIKFAQSRAGMTATEVDDQFVSDHLPKILERKVHDIGVSDLDRDEAITEKVLDDIADMSAEL